MHRKLRLRFLLISWALMLLFLAALCTGISLYMYSSAVRETEDALRKAIETQTLTDETRGMAALRLDEHGTIREAEQSHMSLSDETLQAIISEMNMDGEQRIAPDLVFPYFHIENAALGVYDNIINQINGVAQT